MMVEAKLGILIAVLGLIVLVSPVLGCFVVTLYIPDSGAYCSNIPQSRLCVYLKSTDSYRGYGVFVEGSFDPYWCGGDNGTHIKLGGSASQYTYFANGTLASFFEYPDVWIIKIDSGKLWFDWSFG